MTRMIAKAYRVADALRAAGVPVVMGGPHVTELPDEALGATAVRATPTPSRSAKPMKPGRASWRTPRAANCRKFTTPVDAYGQEAQAGLAAVPADPLGHPGPASSSTGFPASCVPS